MVAASNSLWKFRKQWFRYASSVIEEKQKYPGYTECPATLNIRNVSLMDAIVIPMMDSPSSGLCQQSNTSSDEFTTMLQQRLQFGWEKGYSNNLPVIFYRETYSEDSDSWHKEFFSQEYRFENGSCLRKKSPDFDDVFYFPDCSSEYLVDSFTSSNTDNPTNQLRSRESRMLTEDPTASLTVLIENENGTVMIENGKDNVNDLPEWHCLLTGTLILLAVLGFFQLLVNKRHKRRIYLLFLVLIGAFLFSQQLLALCFSLSHIEDRSAMDVAFDSSFYKMDDLHLWEKLRLREDAMMHTPPNIKCNTTTTCYYRPTQNNKTDSYLYIALTSDVHGHVQNNCERSKRKWCYPGASSLATVIKQLHGEPYLLLDTGDALFGGGEQSNNNTLIVDTMNQLGYHAMGLGNHDWDLGQDHLIDFIRRARFPILASNIVDEKLEKDDEESLISFKYLHVENDVVNLCVVGVTTSETNPFANREISIEDSVLEYAKTLKQEGKCNQVILLSHSGMHVDQRLAAASSANENAIDLILGGHSHFITGASSEPESIEFGHALPDTPFFFRGDGTDVPIVHIGSYGRNMGLIKLKFRSSANGPILKEIDGHLLPLDKRHHVTPNEEMQSWMKEKVAALPLQQKDDNGFVSIRVMDEKASLRPREDDEVCGFACRNHECTLGNLITDAMRHAVIHNSNKLLINTTKYPIVAVMESGSLRDCVTTNNEENFQGVLPWPNHLVMLTVTGNILLDMLQHGIRQPGGGAFLQTSGMQYRFSKHMLLEAALDTRKPGRSIGRENEALLMKNAATAFSCGMMDMKKEGNVPIRNNTYYNIVMTDWLASGGDGFSTVFPALQDQQRVELPYHSLRHLVLDYIKQASPRIQIQDRLCSVKIKSASSNAVTGMLGGYAAYIAAFPLYTLFVRKSIKHGPTSKSFLCRGVLLGSVATSLCQFLYFLVYHSEWLEESTSIFLRSLIAAISTAVLTNPLWVVVTRLQAMEHKQSIVQIIKALLKESGYAGFFKGISMNLAMSCFPVIRQVVMEFILFYAAWSNQDAGKVAISAGLGACVATILTTPIQRWRVRLQKGLSDGITLANLWDGVMLKTLHSFCSSFILFMVKISLDESTLAAFWTD